jgi:uncharacterized protein YecE (DUF72 family)
LVYVGCAVWAYDGWANSFFPQGLPKTERLRAYADRLTAVEANSTFYAVPSPATVQRWRDGTPETFRFCPKFPRAISHMARLQDVAPQTEAFVALMQTLGPRLGPVMLQLPPTFGPDQIGALRDFLATTPRGVEIGVEVRHPGWFEPSHADRLDSVLAEVGAARIVFDSRPAHASTAPEAVSAQEKKPNVPLVAIATQPFVVMRYIASPILSENDPFLSDHAQRIAGWLAEGRRVYCFAHCPVEALSPGIARDLYHRVAAHVALPPLPWERATQLEQSESPESSQGSTQLSLF